MGAGFIYPWPIVRFQVGCSARFNDLQHTAPSTMKHTTNTLEFSAWQTKTVSATRIRKHPVPLICPMFSFTGHMWWQPLLTWWTRLSSHPAFEAIDYLIPTISKDGGQSMESRCQWNGRDLHPRHPDWDGLPLLPEASPLKPMDRSPEFEEPLEDLEGLVVTPPKKETPPLVLEENLDGEIQETLEHQEDKPAGAQQPLLVKTPADKLGPPNGPLRVVSSSRKSGPGGTFKIHLLTTENKGVGCGWQPSINKAQDLNPLDHRSEPLCYQECARCFRLFGFPSDWPVDPQPAEDLRQTA